MQERKRTREIKREWDMALFAWHCSVLLFVGFIGRLKRENQMNVYFCGCVRLARMLMPEHLFTFLQQQQPSALSLSLFCLSPRNVLVLRDCSFIALGTWRAFRWDLRLWTYGTSTTQALKSTWMIWFRRNWIGDVCFLKRVRDPWSSQKI